MRARLALLIVGALAVAVLGGCVPGRDSGQTAERATPSPDEVATDAQGVDRCVPASDELVAAISDELAGQNSISNAWTVRSRQFDSVYFTSAVVGGQVGQGEETATWASLAPEGGQFLFAVTDLAKGLGDFAVDDTFSGADDGVRESQRCARTR